MQKLWLSLLFFTMQMWEFLLRFARRILLMILNYLNYFWIILQSIPLTANPRSATCHLLGSNSVRRSSTSRFLRPIPWNWTSKVNSMLHCALPQKFLRTKHKWLIMRYFHLHPRPAKWNQDDLRYRKYYLHNLHNRSWLTFIYIKSII